MSHQLIGCRAARGSSAAARRRRRQRQQQSRFFNFSFPQRFDCCSAPPEERLRARESRPRGSSATTNGGKPLSAALLGRNEARASESFASPTTRLSQTRRALYEDEEQHGRAGAAIHQAAAAPFGASFLLQPRVFIIMTVRKHLPGRRPSERFVAVAAASASAPALAADATGATNAPPAAAAERRGATSPAERVCARAPLSRIRLARCKLIR